MDYLTTGDVAKLIGYSEETVRRWFDDGTLPGRRLIPSAHRRIPKAEFEQWAQERGFVIDWSKLDQ